MARTAKPKKEVSMEEALWKSADKLRGFLEKNGTPNGPYDMQIVAQGIARGFILITQNI